MGDNQIVVVELSIRDEVQAVERAGEIRDWMLGLGVIAVREDGLEECGDFVPGPNVLSASPDFDGPEWIRAGDDMIHRYWPSSLRWNGVDIDASWGVRTALEMWEVPCCPRCRSEAPGREFMDLVDPWWGTRIEPALTCPACETATPLGNWTGNHLAAGHLAVEFHNWNSVTEDFLMDLRSRMGSRTRVIHCHL